MMEETLKSWLKRLKWHESTVSMFLGALVVIVAGILLYNFFSAPVSEEIGEISEEAVEEYTLELTEEEGKFIPQGLPIEHVISRGEHLWKISEKYYGNGYNWVDIAQANDLANPGLIFSGQKLTIPKVELRVAPQISVGKPSTQVAGAITHDSYSVAKGDTLWSIAVRAYQDGYQWPKIYQANRGTIDNPDLIEVGMQLTLPREL